MTYECIYHHPAESGRHPTLPGVPLMSAFERSRWDELLPAEYDLILIGGIPWPYYPDAVRQQILRKVEQGAGLLIVAHSNSWPDPEDGLFKLHREAQDETERFTRELPRALLPHLQHDRLVTTAAHGRGRIAIVSYHAGTRPTRGAALIPSYVRTAADLAPAERAGMPLNEWRYAFLARVALAAAGRAAERGVSLRGAAETLAADAAEADSPHWTRGAAATAATVRFELLDPFRERLWEREVDCSGVPAAAACRSPPSAS